MANQLENIGLAMQGFGAGIQGNLPQFQQAQNQKQQMEFQQEATERELQLAEEKQRQEMLKQREQAMFQDAQAGLNLAEKGDYDSVLSLATNRLQSLQQFPDADPSGTQTVTKLALAARNGNEEAQQLLKEELESAVEIGRSRGYLERPERDTKVVGDALVDTSTGEEVYRSSQGGQVSTLSTDEKAQMGFPENSVVQRKEDGSLNIVFDPSSDVDQRQRKINNLVEQGIPENRAANIVDGTESIEINPNTGKVVSINEATGDVQELPISGGEAEVPKPKEGKTLYDQANEATGLVSGAKALWSDVAGQVSEEAVAEGVVDARTRMNTATNELIRALSINPRFPVGEINRIKEEIKLDPSIARSPGALQSRMRALDDQLRLRLDQAKRDANDPNLPEQVRSDQAQNASAIENFLSTMGAPDNISMEMFSSPEAVQQLPEDDLRRWIRDEATDQQLESLPDNISRSIKERLGGGS